MIWANVIWAKVNVCQITCDTRDLGDFRPPITQITRDSRRDLGVSNVIWANVIWVKVNVFLGQAKSRVTPVIWVILGPESPKSRVIHVVIWVSQM